MNNNEIVVYHNDTNRVSLGNLGENEARLLFALFEKLKNKHQQTLVFEMGEIKLLISKNYNFKDKEIAKIVKGLWDKIKAANFWILLPKRDENVMLFKTFAINYSDDKKEHVKNIEICVNEKFDYLLNNIIGNFTTFELEEFQALSGKYSQSLYRLLKQYKGTGYARFEWDKFVNIMNIPKTYRQSDIDQFVLKPTLKELTKERTLFDQVRIPFENLTYEKIKDKSQRGRGGKIVAIVFNFKKQGDCIDVRTKDEKIEDLRVENSQLIQEKSTALMEKAKAKEETKKMKEAVSRLQEQNYHIEHKEYTDLRIDKRDKFRKIQTSHIVKILKKKNEADLNSKERYYLIVEFLNITSDTKWTMEFKSLQHLCNYMRKQTLTQETSKHNFMLANSRKITNNSFINILFDLQEFLNNDSKVKHLDML